MEYLACHFGLTAYENNLRNLRQGGGWTYTEEMDGKESEEERESIFGPVAFSYDHDNLLIRCTYTKNAFPAYLTFELQKK